MTTNGSIYLDHNATTPARPAVIAKMIETLGFPGNASAVHKPGREARRLIEDSRQTLMRALNAGPRDVLVFTSGATEANNMALAGAGMERTIVSAIEHPSVLFAAPEKIPVLPSGIIDIPALDALLTDNTRQTLISVMLVNNETGVIQPVADVVALAKKHGCLVHCDAVQAFGKIPLDLQQLGADFVTLSAHKMSGPQGVGCLILRNCVATAPLLRGGNQEKSLRAGTENLAGIVGFAEAARHIDLAAFQKLAALRDKIETTLKKEAPDLEIFGHGAPRVPNTTLFAAPGLSSETQLIALDLAGISVSNGSACSSGTVKPSHVLKAMGVSDALAQSSLRISLGWNTVEKDVDYFIEKWLEMHKRVKEKCQK